MATAPRPRSVYTVHVARALAAARKEKGWTQEELAEQAGVSVRYLQRIEGKARLPDLPILDTLRRALGATWDKILPR